MPYTTIKNSKGQYEKVKVKEDEVPDLDVSLDDVEKRVRLGLERAVKHLVQSITSGDVSREIVGALKDCQVMLKDLKKEEKDFLSTLTEEELNKLKAANASGK